MPVKRPLLSAVRKLFDRVQPSPSLNEPSRPKVLLLTCRPSLTSVETGVLFLLRTTSRVQYGE